MYRDKKLYMGNFLLLTVFDRPNSCGRMSCRMSNLYGSKKTFTILICENCISTYSDMRQEKTHAALIFILLCLNPDHNVSH